MFGESLDLGDVLKKLKRADESLTEFVAPLWPGVQMAAVWIEGRARLFHLATPPEAAGYYLLGTQEQQATVLRPAEEAEASRYRGYLEKAKVILLEHDLAYPASFAERLQGITDPRPIHFANAQPLQPVVARFDGLNLLFDCLPGAEKASPLAGLFGESSIFSPGELLDVPGQASASGGAESARQALLAHPETATEFQLKAVLEPAGAILHEWSQTDGQICLHWRRLDEAHDIKLATAASPITSGICLPGAQGFNPASLTRLLLEHALDAWRT
jgi:hypothetical protein